MSKRICRGDHPLLILEETSEMGGWVRCLVCKDTFHASAQKLAESYHHAHEIEIDPRKDDRDFFIHEAFLK